MVEMRWGKSVGWRQTWEELPTHLHRQENSIYTNNHDHSCRKWSSPGSPWESTRFHLLKCNGPNTSTRYQEWCSRLISVHEDNKYWILLLLLILLGIDWVCQSLLQPTFVNFSNSSTLKTTARFVTDTEVRQSCYTWWSTCGCIKPARHIIAC